MPRFKTPAGNSPKTFEEIISKFCPYFRDESKKAKDKFLKDFAKIGALLQDSDVCNQHLAGLNTAMEAKYGAKLKQEIDRYKMSNGNADPTAMQYIDVRDKIASPRAANGGFRPMDVTEKDSVNVPAADHYKFWGSLSAVLSEKEAKWGFNWTRRW